MIQNFWLGQNIFTIITTIQWQVITNDQSETIKLKPPFTPGWQLCFKLKKGSAHFSNKERHNSPLLETHTTLSRALAKRLDFEMFLEPVVRFLWLLCWFFVSILFLIAHVDNLFCVTHVHAVFCSVRYWCCFCSACADVDAIFDSLMHFSWHHVSAIFDLLILFSSDIMLMLFLTHWCILALSIMFMLF